MRKHILLFFSAFIFFAGCKPDSAPSGILKADEMVSLLTAVHLTDGHVFNIDPNPDSLYKYGTYQYLAVFKAFHTDSSQFRRSFKYYTTRPAELEEIYDKVFKNLQAKSDSITKIMQPKNYNALPKK